jgi:cyclic pyranopterin phosphate synthase
MPLDSEGNWREEMVMRGNEIRTIIHREYPLTAAESEDRSETARRFRFADGAGEVGFINPVSEPFCESCNRIRLTADGRLRTCLFSIEETDLSGPLRDGATDADLAERVRAAVLEKELKHKINEGDAFQRASRSMSQIGG